MTVLQRVEIKNSIKTLIFAPLPHFLTESRGINCKSTGFSWCTEVKDVNPGRRWERNAIDRMSDVRGRLRKTHGIRGQFPQPAQQIYRGLASFFSTSIFQPTFFYVLFQNSVGLGNI